MNTLSGPLTLIKRSVSLFFEKKNFTYFFKIQAFLLPLAFIVFAWGLVLTFGPEKLDQGLSTNPVFLTFSTAVGFINSIIYLFVAVASIEGIRRVLGNEALSVKGAFLVSKARVWKYSLTQVSRGVIIALGFLLLVIPGIIFSIWFSFSGIEVVLNKAGVGEALKKSKSLVKGRFWPVAGRLFVFGLFALFVSILFSTLPLGIGNLISPVFGVLFLLPSYLLYQELQARA